MGGYEMLECVRCIIVCEKCTKIEFVLLDLWEHQLGLSLVTVCWKQVGFWFYI